MKKRIVIVLLIVLLAAFAAFFFFRNNNQAGASFRTTGIIDGLEVNLSSKVAGRILWVCCGEGENLKEGQPAVRLESDELAASAEQAKAGVEKSKADISVAESSIENVKASIKSAEADIRSAEADIEMARVQREELRKEMERSKTLYKSGYIALSSLDQAVAAFDTATASQYASQARLASAQARKEAALAQLNSAGSQLKASLAMRKESEAAYAAAQSRLNDMLISAPISGTVIFRSLEKGESVLSPGATILTVVDLAGLYARIDLEELLVGPVRLNQEAIIRVDGMPEKTFKGRVSEIGRYAEFATQRDITRGRQDLKTFRVKIKIDDPSGLLKPGMTVSVELPRKA